MHDLIDSYLKVERMDECILNAVFRNMWDFEYVPVHAITRECRIDEEKLENLLKKLSSLGILENKHTEYLGTGFTFKGLSVFSLKRLVRKGSVSMIGNILGEGKESVVFNALNDRNEELVVKFHRVGYPSFKKVREKRDYGTLHHTVLTVRSARKEYRALRRLYGYASVPKPVAWEGNAVVTELIDAKELFRVRLENPDEVLDMIINEIRNMFWRGVVHGDLSQFNILVNESGIWIIDFPQYIEAGSDGSDDVLARDVANILEFFRRNYRLKKDLNDVLRYIRGET